MNGKIEADSTWVSLGSMAALVRLRDVSGVFQDDSTVAILFTSGARQALHYPDQDSAAEAVRFLSQTLGFDGDQS